MLIIFVDHNKLWKILKEMGVPDHFTCFLRNLNVKDKTYLNLLPAPSETYMQVRKQQLELDMEQQTGSK